MANESVATHKVPKHLITSPNCMAIPNAWDYSFGTPETTFFKGDLFVVDLDACPKHGDIVIMCRKGKAPFGRKCYFAPVAEDARKNWVMGVLDEDGETVYTFDLGQYEWFGVVTGKVPSNERRN